jgi:hypothetical protein
VKPLHTIELEPLEVDELPPAANDDIEEDVPAPVERDVDLGHFYRPDVGPSCYRERQGAEISDAEKAQILKDLQESTAFKRRNGGKL